MFSMNVHANLMHIDQNAHHKTLSYKCIHTQTKSNLWRVTNVMWGGVSVHFWIFFKVRASFFNLLSIQ